MCRKLLWFTLLIVVCGAAGARAAEFEWIRAAYCDTRYPSAWAGVGTATRDALVAAGYTALNADELKTWMTARIADKKYSVVVFCQDVVPDTVVESQSDTCTLRKYLNAGGKIVWYSDIPFYYWGHANGNMDTWGDAGAPAVLGFNTSSAPRDAGFTAAITPAGTAWGLTQTWTSQRPLAPSVTTRVTILATDDSGNAPAWVKHYAANDNFRGFVRFRDTGGQADVQDIMRVAEYVGFNASNPQPADGAVGITAPLIQWGASSFAVWHEVYFGTTPDLGPADFKGRQFQAMTMYWHVPGIEAGVTYYWRIDEVEADGTVRTGDVWSFMAEPLTAYVPQPADGAAGQAPGLNLAWLPGKGAKGQHVYFGTDMAAVTNGEASVDQGVQTETTFNTGALRASTTYYWRVDTETTGGVEQGAVWSFSTADAGPASKIVYETWMGIGGTAISDLTNHPRYPENPSSVEYVDTFASPVDWADNYGQRFWGWLKPPQSGDYTFWIAGDDAQELWLSTDGSPSNAEVIASVPGWTPALDWDNTGGGAGGPSQKSSPVTLQQGQKYYIMAIGKEGGGGDSTAVAWQGGSIAAREVIKAEYVDAFYLAPLQAFGPIPSNGAVDTAQSLSLQWNAGDKAQQHEVYLGDDKDAVAAADPSSALFKGRQAGTTFNTGALEWGKTYYWRVDEINTGDAESPWVGTVWGFTTANFIPVDDFESYVDDVEGRIFQTWIDGWGYTEPAPGDPGNGTGSTVGYLDPPYAETQIVHGGRQSMPLDYNNIISPYYSETERTFDVAQDWTAGGVTDLSLWVRGYAAAQTVNETSPGAFSVTGEGVDIWGVSDQFTYVYKTLNSDGSLVARVASNGTGSNNWAKGGVMIRDSLAAGSTHAMQVMTGSDGNGASFQWRGVADDVSSNSDALAAVAPPYWVKIERVGNSISGYLSPNGTTWTQQGTSQVIFMTSPCYIGLCVTSHAAGENRTFEFDNVKATGATGQWQSAEIGLTRNDPATLYVAIQDSTGKVAVVPSTDPGLVNVTGWTEWPIPLSQFGGVSLNRVTKMFLGVGNRNNPTPGGAGMLFIDDIRVVKPEPPAAE